MSFRIRVHRASQGKTCASLHVTLESGIFKTDELAVAEDDLALQVTLKWYAFVNVDPATQGDKKTLIIDTPDFDVKLLAGKVLVPKAG